MGRILVYTNLTTSTDVVSVENFLRFSDLEFDFETIYYNHAIQDHSKYDKVFALIDTGCIVVSDEFKKDLVHKVETLANKGVRIVLCNFWESEDQILKTDYPYLLRDYDFDVWHGGTTYFWYIMQQRYKKMQFNFEHDIKSFDFLFLNKAQRPHRDLLFDSLLHQEILSNSLYSYHHRAIKLDPKFEVPKYRNAYPRYGADRDLYEEPYNHCAWNIVPETSADEAFMTEKLWKPIVAKQPFIVHAKVDYLKTLRALGFKTYGTHIDETYDDEQDLDLRTKRIVDVCRYLKGSDHLAFYESSQHIREHNHKTFFDETLLKGHVNQYLRLLLKLVDY